MIFHQLKMIRKGSKPPIWRRGFVPANITFAQMAVVLEEMLDYVKSADYEFEFYQKKVQIREWREDRPSVRDFWYDFMNAPDTYVNDLFRTEKWFTFRVESAENSGTEYRVEIEKCAERIVGNQNIEIEWPFIRKEVGYEGKACWSNAKELNQIFQSEYEVHYGKADYRGFEELLDSVKQKKEGLIACHKIVNRTEHNAKSANTGLHEFANLVKAISKKEKEEEQNGIEVSRKPTVRDILLASSNEELVDESEWLHIRYKGYKKNEMAERIENEILRGSRMKEFLLTKTDEQIQEFESAMERSCFLPSEEERESLRLFEDLYYLASYEDHYVEVPQEVIQVYRKINTPEFQQQRSEVSWMTECLYAFCCVYGIAPVKIAHRLYRKREGFHVNFEEFMDVFNRVPKTFNPCIIENGQMIAEIAYQKGMHRKIELMREDIEFYLLSVQEIKDYAKKSYQVSNESYQKLHNFLMKNVGMSREESHELCQIVNIHLSGGIPISEVFMIIQKEGCKLKSEQQAEQLSAILTDVDNNTRKINLCGYTSNEFVKMKRERFFPSQKFVYEEALEAEKMEKGGGFDLGARMTAPSEKKKIYPNDPCPCGSGKKYKKCCGRK